jgi:hypothetical protein
MISELRHRDPLLFWIGAAMMLALVVCVLLSIGDQRLILGINPWIKPMKFLISTTIFLWTVAWFMPETRPDGRARKIVRWTIGPAMLIEISLILLQSARGTTSHFNIRSPLDGIIFSVMGITIFVNTLAMMLFLWIVRRDTPPHRAGYLWGVRLGVAMFLLASLQGALIVSNNAHTVGAPDGGPGLPFVNWSTTAGDLRIAHFFGMHAMQALPLLGFFLDKTQRGLPTEAPGRRWGRNLLFAVSILWLAVMGGLLVMAMQGAPIIRM